MTIRRTRKSRRSSSFSFSTVQYSHVSSCSSISKKPIHAKRLKLPTLTTKVSVLAVCALCSSAFAGPQDGIVVGGAGSISQSGTTTTINQSTDRMAIDWQSYNVGANETVQYIQPDSSSVSLNRVLSNAGSSIQGQINANGQVFLINPNGVIFGENATINAGGFLASGLTIDPNDFMNGDFAFSAMDGADGFVINNGLINAATGGSVSLLGERVENNGMINAQLGAVNLAAGKEAVVTFDTEGLVGVRITKEVLQDELGVDPAVINTGEITAESGQILMTASVSQDIFSDAVNSGDLERATSVVVDDDGSFTLGGGADLVNTGTISASAVEGSNNSGGEVVLLGDNITSSGVISADGHAVDSHATGGGSIEIHSVTTTELTENSITSANAKASGSGGDIKILGTNVGLLDEAQVSANGVNGGGQVLIGGDVTGSNEQIRNADFIYIGQDTQTSVDATENGDGGKLITFASDTARIYGELSARGGVESGTGGFVETSGLRGFEILSAPILDAADGGGEWLIDPFDITITNGVGDEDDVNTLVDDEEIKIYESDSDNDQLSWQFIEGVLDGINGVFGRTVTIQTADGDGSAGEGDIIFDLDGEDAELLQPNFNINSTLILNAHNDIVFDNQNLLASAASGDTLNLTLIADSDNNGLGDIQITGTSQIDLNGGVFTADSENFTFSGTSINNIGTGSTISVDADFFLNGAISGVDLAVNAIGNAPNVFTLSTDSNWTGGVFELNSGNGADTLNFQSANLITVMADAGSAGDTMNLFTNVAGEIQGGDTADTFNIMLPDNSALDAILRTTGGNDQFRISTAGLTATIQDEGGNANNNTDTIILLYDSPDATTWTTTNQNNGVINGVNGTITNGSGTIMFSGIESFEGSNGVDEFVLGHSFTSAAASATVTGSIDGSGGMDVFTINAGISIGSIDGGAGDDTFNINNVLNGQVLGGADNDTFNLSANVTGGTGTFDVVGDAGLDTFIIQADNLDLSITGGTDTALDSSSDTVQLDTITGGTWELNAENTASSLNTNLEFTDIQVVNGATDGAGNSDSDTFSLNGFSGQINGRTGDDILTGRNQNNFWVVDDIAGFSVGDNAIVADATDLVTFSNIETLNGNAAIDTFDINSAFAGTINSGDGNDAFDIGAAVTQIFGQGDDDSFVVSASGFDVSIDGGNDNDTLTGPDVVSFWLSQDGVGAVNVQEDIVAADADWTITASGVENLVGGSGSDTFVLNHSFTQVSGSAGNDIFTVAVNPISVNLDGGADLDTFNIDAAVTGNIDGGSGVDVFNLASIVMGNVLGGNDNDTFNFNSGADITGDVSGQFGDDIFELNAGTVSGTIFGAEDNDTFNINASGLSFSIEGGEDVDETNTIALESNTGGTFNLNSAIGGTLDGTLSFTEIQTVLGSDVGNDNFTLDGYDTVNNTVDARGGLDDSLTTTADLTYNLSTGSGVQNLEQLEASVSELTLTVEGDSSVVWNIDGANAGDVQLVNDADSSIDFLGFENLTGSSQNDEFNITSSLSGTLEGGAGDDTFNFNIGTAIDGVVSGQQGNDTFELNAGTVTGFIFGAQDNDTFNINTSDLVFRLDGGDEGTNEDVINLQTGIGGDWVLNPDDSISTVNTSSSDLVDTLVSFIGFEDVLGANADDTFTLVDGFTASVDARGGDSDTLLATGDILIDLDNTGEVTGGIANVEAIQNQDPTQEATLTVISTSDTNWVVRAPDDNEIDNGIDDGFVSNDVNQIAFSDYVNLTGGDQADSFLLEDGGNVSGLIDGAGGLDDYTNESRALLEIGVDITNVETISIDTTNASSGSTITAENRQNIWTVETSIDAIIGELVLDGVTLDSTDTMDDTDTYVIELSGFDSFIGNTSQDTFILDSVSAPTGVTYDAAGGGFDIVDVSNINAATVDVVLGDSISTYAGVANAEILKGGGDTVLNANQSTDSANWDWYFYDFDETTGADSFTDGLNDFEVSLGFAGDVGETFRFIDISDIRIADTGTNSRNIFNFNSPDGTNSLGRLDGSIELDSATGTGSIIADNISNSIWSLDDFVSGNLSFESGEVAAFSGIQSLVGSGSDTLVGSSALTLWNISGANSGTISDSNPISLEAINFSGMQNLHGNTGQDNFVFEAGGSITGEVLGSIASAVDGAEPDTLQIDEASNWVITGSGIGEVTPIANGFSSIESVIGSAGSDVFQIASDELTINIDGGMGTDTLDIIHDQNSIWRLAFDASGDESMSVDNISFTEIEIANGNDAIDTLTVSEDVSAVDFFFFGGNDVVAISEVFGGDVDTGEGSDSLSVDGDTTISGVINLGGGNDELTITGDISPSGSINLGAGDDQVFFESGVETVNAILGGDDEDEITFNSTVEASWDISDISITVLDAIFASFETINGSTLQDTFNINSNTVQQINGRGGDDVFNLQSDILDISIDGGTHINGDEILLSHTAASTWTVDGNNSSVNNVDFSNFEILTGNSAVDTVNVMSSFLGAINTLGESDQVNLAANVLSVDLGAGNDILNVDEDGVESSIDGGGGTNTLNIAHNEDSNWTLNTETSTVDNISFTDFSILEGNDFTDVVTVETDFNGRITTFAGNDRVVLEANISDGNDATTDVSLGGDGDQLEVAVSGVNASVSFGDADDSISNDTILITHNESSEWVIAGESTGQVSSATSDTAEIGIVSFDSAESLQGGSGIDEFTVLSSGDIANISGEDTGVTSSVADRLIVESASGDTVDWEITNLNSGSVAGQVGSFSGIENITGGEGSDNFVFEMATARISGLIDGGEFSDDSTELDYLDLTGLGNTGLIVELGEDADVSAPAVEEMDRTGFIIVNAHNFESIEAANGSGIEEQSQWIAVTHSRDIQWIYPDANTNNGSIAEVDLGGDVVDSTLTELLNFGSLQGGFGTETNGNDFGITGFYVSGSGDRRVRFTSDDPNEFYVVDITENLVEVTVDNAGYTLLRITDEDVNFNVANVWLVDDENSGTFTAFGDTSNPSEETHSFTFSGVDNLQGGSGSDTFNFVAEGILIDGSIDGGLGQNIVNTEAATTSFNFGLASLEVETVTNSSPVGLRGTDLERTLSRDDVIDLINISTLSTNASDDVENVLLGNNDIGVNYSWDLNETALTVSDADSTLTFTGIDEVIGGEANDTFNVSSLDLGFDRFVGNGGDDSLNITEDTVLPYDIFLRGSDEELIASDTSRAIYVDSLESIDIVSASGGLPTNDQHAFYADDTNNIWNIGVNSNARETLFTSIRDEGNDSVLLQNVNYLVGGSATDSFVFAEGGTVQSIDGGGGEGANDLDTLLVSRDLIFSLQTDAGLRTSGSDDNLFVRNLNSITANENQTNTLVATNTSNNWFVDGANNTLNETFAFSGIRSIIGGSLDDAFVFDGDTLNGLIDGGDNSLDAVDSVELQNLNDTLVTLSETASDGQLDLINIESLIATENNTNLSLQNNLVGAGLWNINASTESSLQLSDEGVISLITFNGFENLIGGAGDDTFIFSEDVNLDSYLAIDGGAGSLINELDVSAITANPVRISFDENDVTADLVVANLSTVRSSNNPDNTLVSLDDESVINEWRITSQNEGDLNGIDFFGFANLVGGSGIDVFTFTSTGSTSGLVDGGGQPAGQLDTVNQSDLAIVEIVFGGDNGFRNIEHVIGNETNSTLQSIYETTTNTWTVDGTNSGSVSNIVEQLTYTGFTDLIGSDGDDTFNLSNGGGVSGSIFGGDGNNILDINLATGFNGEVTYDGSGSVNDQINVSGASSANRFDLDYFAQIENGSRLSYNGNDAASNPFIYNLTYDGVESLSNNAFVDTLSVNGVENAVDTVNIQGNNFFVETEAGERFADVSYSDVNSLNIAGEESDFVSITDVISIQQIFSINNSTVLSSDNATVNASTAVELINTGQIGDSENALNIVTTNLVLDGTQGDVFITQDGDLNGLSILGPLGLVDLDVMGAITSSSTLESDGVINISSTEDISLLSETNRLTGQLNLDATNNIELTNGSTNLGMVTASNFILNAAGDVNDVDDALILVDSFTVNGANGTEQVILDGASNIFGNILVENIDRLAVNDNGDQLVIGGSAAGDYIVTATGDIRADELNAADINLSSTNGSIVVGVDSTQNALNSYQVSANGVSINSAITVQNGLTSEALSIDGNNGDVDILADVNSNNAGVVISGENVSYSAGELSANEVLIESTNSTELASSVNVDGSFSINSQGSVDLLPSGAALFEVGSLDIVGTNVVFDRSIQAISVGDTAGNVTVSDSASLTTTDRADIDTGNFIVNSNGIIDLNGSIVAENTAQIISTGQTVVLNGELQATELMIDAADDINMEVGADVSGVDLASLSATNDILLRRVDATGETGLVYLESRTGAVSDLNDDGAAVLNIQANSLESITATGFGTENNPIETAVLNMSVVNDTGIVSVENTGDVNVSALRTDSGVFLTTNDGNVTLVNDRDPQFSATSEVFDETGVVNAGIDGQINLDIDGFLNANPATADVSNPEIIGSTVEIATTGQFGTNGRPLVIFAPDVLIVRSLGGGLEPLFQEDGIPAFIDLGDSNLIDPSIGTTVNDLLIDVETAGDIDPEVFNDLRNFSFDNISILMPRDQRYDEDDEEDEEEEDFLSSLH